MKKFLVLIALVLGSFSLHAQSDIKVGGILEGGIANITNGSDFVGKSGAFAIGGIVQFPLSQTIFLNTELRYSTKGADDGLIKASYGYLEIPAIFNFKFGDFGLMVGPSINFNISSDYSVSDSQYSLLYANDPAALEIGAVLGFDYMFSKNIGLDVRCNAALTPLIADSELHNIQILGGIKVLF